MAFSLRQLIVIAMFTLCMTFAFGQTTNVPTGMTENPKEVSVLPADEDANVEPKESSVRLRASRLEISGNTLVSTEALLKNLPDSYITDDGTQYDFTVIHEIIASPDSGKIISRKTLQGLTKYLLSVYQDMGYAGIYVYVPAKASAQDSEGVIELKGGVLPLQVIEGRIDEINLVHYNFDREPREPVLREDIFKEWAPVDANSLIEKKKLNEFINLMNVNPDRYVSPVITRAAEPNSLNLSFDIYEADPWHFYLQIDNSGMNEKRKWTPRAGLTNTNLTGRDDRLSVMYQSKPYSWGYMEDNYSLYSAYDAPVFSPKLRMGVFAGYNAYDLAPGSGAPLTYRGRGKFFGANISYNLFQIDDWLFDITSSYIREESKSTPSLQDIFTKSDITFNTYVLGGNLYRYTDMSRTHFGFTMETTMKDGTSQSELDAMPRANDKRDYELWNISLSHMQYLDDEKTEEFSGSFRQIITNDRLPSFKMSSFGGLYSVRGYGQDESLSDGGTLASVQYRKDITETILPDVYAARTADTSAHKAPISPYVPTKTWLLGFSDYGRSETKDPVAGESKSRTLLSAGLGCSMEFGDTLLGNVYYAWPLKTSRTTGSGDSGQWYFSMLMRW